MKLLNSDGLHRLTSQNSVIKIMCDGQIVAATGINVTHLRRQYAWNKVYKYVDGCSKWPLKGGEENSAKRRGKTRGGQLSSSVL